MTEGKYIIEQIKVQGLLPLYFHHDKTTCIEIMNALFNAGIRIIEFTNRGAAALENFTEMRKLRDAELPGLLLGAGTIKTKEDATRFIEAGADFIISPGLNAEVGRYCTEKNILWIPGCMTPTEIIKAEETGATLIKLFPGNLLGPSFVNAIKDLFPALSFIPTGGVAIEKENLTAWFRSGVIGVGGGSNVITKDAVNNGDYTAIQQSASSAISLINEVRKSIFRNH